MKTTTKAVALLLALTLAIGLFAGCGQSKQSEAPAPAETQTPAQPAATDAPKAAEEPKPTEAPKPAETPVPEKDTHIVIDGLGREVEVPNHPQRIALGATVLPNIVFALQGHMNNIVTISPSAYSGWEISTMRYLAPELEGVDTKMVDNDYNMNLEALASADVDLVFNWEEKLDQAEQLEALGIPCVILPYATNLATLQDLMAVLGDALNCQERTEFAIQWYKDTQDYFDSKADAVAALKDEEKPRVLHFQRVEKMQVYGKGMNPNVTKMEGGVSYLLPAEVSAPTMEDIIAFDPEIIFLSNFDNITPEDLYENRIPGQEWSGVSAVINHRVYKVPSGLYRWAAPNTFEKPFYMRWTASIVQPEIFSDIDVRAELKQFYHDYYSYDLSEEQLDEIFRVEVNQYSK